MALLDSNFWKKSTVLYFLCTRNRFFGLEVLTFKMDIKVSAWKPEVNENVTLSTVNFGINDNHRIWPYNLHMPIFKWFSLIEALVISQNLGKFHENWSLKHEFRSIQQSEFCGCKPFFCMFEWNIVLARWNWIQIQDLIWLPKYLMNLSFFTKIFWQKCAIELKFW